MGIFNRYGPAEREAVDRVITRGLFSGFFKDRRGGPEVTAFEKELSRRQGMDVLTCSNGTSALHLALLAAGISSGQNVAVPALTFAATAAAVMYCGAKPIIIDVDPDTYNMSMEDLRRVVESTPVDAIIPVSLLGVPCELTGITELAEDYDMWVIEDNAQALGALYKGKPAGSWGHLSTFSFQDTKVITTFGEGGAVGVSVGEDVVDRVISLRNHGYQYDQTDYLCFNYRMTEVQAAVGLAQLEKLDTWNRWMRENRDVLRDKLEPFGFKFQSAPEHSYAIHYLLGATHEDSEFRERVVRRLRQNGWGLPQPGRVISLGYEKTIQDLPFLRQYRRECPVADWLVKHFAWFDVHRWQSPETFAPVADQIAEQVAAA